ncbi:hypothetical protein SAMN04487926_1537 [Paraburkholderia steynii]|uniref:Uncharacterized protein n=1 Tax=Paraburkholderia steynii TaxID=1245441 RepID=A0A7Z7BKL0_9BURK|nr:hypothetical protein [Paraburkholderia steynii]SDJ46930.1 hypothetical protein SAMN04487926_1537 [Paraburkholderia steynii]
MDLLIAGDRHTALKLAKQAASGKTANDATTVRTLATVVDETGSANQNAVTDILLRNLKAPERSWRIQVDIANRLSMTDRAKARVFLDQQFQYFGKAPKLWPDVIAFYQRTGDDQLSKQMALACAAALPDYRNACVTASQSAAELAQVKAKTKAHVTIVTEQMKKKWFK